MNRSGHNAPADFPYWEHSMSESQQGQNVDPVQGEVRVINILLHKSRAFLLLVAMFLQILLSPIGYPDSILPLIMREFIVLAAVFMVIQVTFLVAALLSTRASACLLTKSSGQ
jgi:hypothetical protein